MLCAIGRISVVFVLILYSSSHKQFCCSHTHQDRTWLALQLAVIYLKARMARIPGKGVFRCVRCGHLSLPLFLRRVQKEGWTHAGLCEFAMCISSKSSCGESILLNAELEHDLTFMSCPRQLSPSLQEYGVLRRYVASNSSEDESWHAMRVVEQELHWVGPLPSFFCLPFPPGSGIFHGYRPISPALEGSHSHRLTLIQGAVPRAVRESCLGTTPRPH